MRGQCSGVIVGNYFMKKYDEAQTDINLDKLGTMK